ncbi:T9SS type A sorting domain-containing protein [Thalassobellus citreus]|uniref:T9SS type A sorting domain-containing protein n=1 Tax=Thalassobellus citreus TaxID=3367752 RepID=UPI0037BA3D67
MKQLLLSISIICSINCFAQEPNPDLFQTWYLYSVRASDGSPGPYVVSEINPNVTPSLTIMEDLTFNGTGACNTFNGTFNLQYPDVLATDQFSHSIDNCGVEIHNDFENEYFGFIQLIGSGYYLSSEDNGMVLNLNTPIFGQAVFKNHPLNITKFELPQIDIYPNPTSSLIYIKSQNSPVLKIEIFNSLGQSIKTIENKFETIDISDLSNGFYIMKIDSKFGTLNKRIIKK